MSGDTQTQGTPGPWGWRFAGTMGRWVLVSSATGETVHMGGPPDVPLSPDQVLIQAAPEVTETLRAIYDAYMRGIDGAYLVPLMQRAADALTKAGRSPLALSAPSDVESGDPVQ